MHNSEGSEAFARQITNGSSQFFRVEWLPQRRRVAEEIVDVGMRLAVVCSSPKLADKAASGNTILHKPEYIEWSCDTLESCQGCRLDDWIGPLVQLRNETFQELAHFVVI